MEDLKLKKEQLEKNISLLISDFVKEIDNNDIDVEICVSKAKQGTRCAITGVKVGVTVNL